METIQLWSIPRGEITHYSFIFRNPEPLGKEFKNISIPNLGAALFLHVSHDPMTHDPG